MQIPGTRRRFGICNETGEGYSVLFVACDQRTDVLNQHRYGHRVEATFGNDDVGVFLRRFDELLVHRLHGRGVLRDDRLHRTPALADVAQDAPRKADIGEVDPFGEDFSAFVFKIQANMNKAHRDRIAFMRICSGKFTAGMEVTHVQGGNKKIKLSQPQQMMAQERHIVDEAYAGDIIGVFDPGIFSIGDTLTTAKPFKFEGIPTFAPEHFARVRQVDTMKRKQFMKGMQQIAQEGAIQIFQEYNMGMEEVIVGVVGVLQFDVLKYRLENEYNVEIRMDTLPYEHIRWIENEDIDMDKLVGTSDMKKIQDLKGRPLLLFVNAWSVGMVLDRNEGLVLSEFGRE